MKKPSTYRPAQHILDALRVRFMAREISRIDAASELGCSINSILNWIGPTGTNRGPRVPRRVVDVCQIATGELQRRSKAIREREMRKRQQLIGEVR